MVVGAQINHASSHLDLPGHKKEANSPKRPPTPLSSVAGSEFSSIGSNSSYTSNESNGYGNGTNVSNSYKGHNPIQNPNRMSHIQPGSPAKINSSFMNINPAQSSLDKGQANEAMSQAPIGRDDQAQVFSPYQYGHQYASPVSSASSGSGGLTNVPQFPNHMPIYDPRMSYYRTRDWDSESVTSSGTEASDDVSNSEEDSDASDESSDYQPSRHPYYREWQQYYAALYSQQQQKQQQQFYNRQSMYPGGFPMMQPMVGGNYGNMGMPFYFNPYMSFQSMMQPQVDGTTPNMDTAALIAQMQNMMLSMNSNMCANPMNQMQSNMNPNATPQFSQTNQFVNQGLPQQSATPNEVNTADSVPKDADTTIQVADSTIRNKEKDEDHSGQNYAHGLLNQNGRTGLSVEKHTKSSELLDKSRKSTIKSNRFPSAPSSIIEAERNEIDSKPRRQSLEINFKPNEIKSHSGDEYSDSESDADASSRSIPDYANETTIGEAEMRRSEKKTQDTKTPFKAEHRRLIDDNIRGEIETKAQDEDEITQSPDTTKAHGKLIDDDKRRYISDYGKFFFDDTEVDVENLLPPAKKPIADETVHRNNSTSSYASYDSIQSENSSKFTVISTQDRNSKLCADLLNKNREPTQEKTRIEGPEKSQTPHESRHKSKRKKSRAKSKRKQNQSMMQAPPPILSPPLPPLPPKSFLQSPASNALSHMSSVPSFASVTPQSANINYPMNDSMSDLKRYSYASPEMSTHQSPMAANYNVRQSLHPMPTPQPKLSDKTLNQKCEEFIHLRSVIASGNKSIEYRLKWIKMLINATNFKLYSYINIKGEQVVPEETARNKLLFIKSSTNHLTKLLNESDSKKRSDEISVSVFFLHACMLMNDFARTYSQDFGVKKDIPKAISYFEKCLNIDPTEHRSLYKIGEIYEYEYPDQLDRALKYYKLSAKTGYYRAIYKISMLYLNVPKLRTAKFFTYLYDLANINFDDVALEGEDMDELEEVVGLACYQLGMIHEGVYPGDLNQDDEFIMHSLEKAPVNYSKSLSYYNKSARLRCLVAAVKLGNVYEKGELTRNRNANKSIQWYLKASTSPLLFKRHPEAMLGLSRWYLTGSQNSCKYIPTPDPAKAVFWCERAIKDFDYPAAYHQMGELCKMGLVSSDPKTWYQKAQSLGFAASPV